MILALLIAGILHPLPQTDWTFYDWCNANIGMGEAYCCGQAGGIWKSGLCVDSETGHVPWYCPQPYLICSPPTTSEGRS